MIKYFKCKEPQNNKIIANSINNSQRVIKLKFTNKTIYKGSLFYLAIKKLT